LEAINWTVYEPALLYVNDGLSLVDVSGTLSNVQYQLVGPGVPLEVSVKFTVNGACPLGEVGVKLAATGMYVTPPLLMKL
jgi:hypothetical protein